MGPAGQGRTVDSSRLRLYARANHRHGGPKNGGSKSCGSPTRQSGGPVTQAQVMLVRRRVPTIGEKVLTEAIVLQIMVYHSGGRAVTGSGRSPAWLSPGYLARWHSRRCAAAARRPVQ